MKTRSPLASRKAFTLVELMVTISIIVLLALILVPVLAGSMDKAKMTRSLAQGKGIYQCLFGEQTVDNMKNPYPSSLDYKNSTDFFRWTVTNQTIDVTYEYFAAGKIAPYTGNRAEEFKEENNAWCIVADLGLGSRNNTPLLFTRNLTIETLADIPYASYMTNTVYEDRVLMINLGGSGALLKREQLDDQFNPWEGKNEVLRP